jgi:hypothetical protein
MADRLDGFDEAFLARARHRRLTAWARVVPLAEADCDDPDDLALTLAERVALVDTLTNLALRDTVTDGTQPRLQRSVARVLKRRR